jgi:superfamily II DNA or RNA helicase
MRLLDSVLHNSNCWDDFWSQAIGLNNQEKGHLFERLTELVLKSRPEYVSLLKNVWRLGDGIPTEVQKHLNLPNRDEGIDLIAETHNGEFWAIQCKFKGDQSPPTYKEISTFGNLAHNYCRNISRSFLFHTGEKGMQKKTLLGEHFTQVGLEFWLSLHEEDWSSIRSAMSGKAVKPEVRLPRPHQQAAIDSASRHFLENNASRGRLIMPCGTGKSLTAFWICSALQARSIIVAVPSLSLIKQSLEDWTRELVAGEESVRPEWLCICSDESTGKLEKDEFVSDTYSLGIPTTTDSEEIRAFLSRTGTGRKIIFTTYQSSERLASAARELNFHFDLAILDEAHKTVGEKSKAFATLLFEENIAIRQRIFMTATERVVRGKNEDVLSMDDPERYGERFFQLSFKDAIHSEQPVICDYKIVTVMVTEEEIADLIEENRMLKDRHSDEQEAQMLAAAAALRKSYAELGIRHAVSFHSSIARAEDFRELNEELNGHFGDLPGYHISSRKSAGERAGLLRDFSRQECSLITNARCLTEGVDVPSIDCVLFADPKQSVVDIVQAAGRALRNAPGKKFGYILLPLVVPDGMELEEFADSGPYRQVVRIISALSTQDERIAEELRQRESGRKAGRGGIIQFSGNVPAGMQMDFSEFADSIETRIWENVGRLNWRPFVETREYVRGLGLKSWTEWAIFSKSELKPSDIPTSPGRTYERAGWINWADWLGTNNIANYNKVFRPFEEAREFVRQLNLKGKNDWEDYRKSGNKPADIPAGPDQTYKNEGWVSWGDFLGTGFVSTSDRLYLPFEEARFFVRELQIDSFNGWRAYSASGKKPDNIPANPNRTYAKSGWISWVDWLGTNKIANHNRVFLPFDEAREIVKKLGLPDMKAWKAYAKSSERPLEIPSNPSRTYLEQGWRGWAFWFGDDNATERNREFIDFEQAREFARQLNLKSEKEWNRYCKTQNKPDHIPKQPHSAYNGNGWISWGNWLGTHRVSNSKKKFLPFEEAREFARSLKLNGEKEWQNYCNSGSKPDDIPRAPSNSYKEKGWKNWADWLGTGKLERGKYNFLPFSEAQEYVQSQNINSLKQWQEFGRSGKRPSNIPSTPAKAYKYTGWVSWPHFLGTKTVATRLREYLSFEEARRLIRSLNLSSHKEWRQYCKSGQKPDNIPSAPNSTYKKQWQGWPDWLRNDFPET